MVSRSADKAGRWRGNYYCTPWEYTRKPSTLLLRSMQKGAHATVKKWVRSKLRGNGRSSARQETQRMEIVCSGEGYHHHHSLSPPAADCSSTWDGYLSVVESLVQRQGFTQSIGKRCLATVSADFLCFFLLLSFLLGRVCRWGWWGPNDSCKPKSVVLGCFCCKTIVRLRDICMDTQIIAWQHRIR